MIEIKTSKCCAVTGHRPEKLLFLSDETSPEFKKLMDIIQQEILSLIQNGITTFCIGMATGIDTWIGEMIVRLKNDYPELQLVGVIPFQGHDHSWSEQDKIRCEQLKKCCDVVILLAQSFEKDSYRKRNQFMIDMSSYLLAVVDLEQKRSGSCMTVNMARKKGIGRIEVNPFTYKIAYEDIEKESVPHG